MKTFTKQEVKDTGRAVTEALAETLAAMGLKGDYAGSLYDATGFTMKIRIARAGEDAEREAFALRAEQAPWLNVLASDYGRTIPGTGGPWRLVDLKPSARRFPLVCTNAEGHRMLFTTAALVQARLLDAR